MAGEEKKIVVRKGSSAKATLTTDEDLVCQLVAIFWSQFEKNAKKDVDYACFTAAINKGALQNIRDAVNNGTLTGPSGGSFDFAKDCSAKAGERAYKRSKFKDKTITRANFETSYDEGVVLLEKLNKRKRKDKRPEILGVIC